MVFVDLLRCRLYFYKFSNKSIFLMRFMSFNCSIFYISWFLLNLWVPVLDLYKEMCIFVSCYICSTMYVIHCIIYNVSNTMYFLLLCSITIDFANPLQCFFPFVWLIFILRFHLLCKLMLFLHIVIK